MRPEQREQTAYLTQITLSKLPGPVLVLLKRQRKVCSVCADCSLGHVRLLGLALLHPQPGEQHSARSVQQAYRDFGEKLLKVEASLAHCFRVLLGISFLEGLFFHFLF